MGKTHGSPIPTLAPAGKVKNAIAKISNESLHWNQYTMAQLPMALVYEIIRYNLTSQFTLLWMSKSFSSSFNKQPYYLQTLMDDVFSISVREFNFDPWI